MCAVLHVGTFITRIRLVIACSREDNHGYDSCHSESEKRLLGSGFIGETALPSIRKDNGKTAEIITVREPAKASHAVLRPPR